MSRWQGRAAATAEETSGRRSGRQWDFRLNGRLLSCAGVGLLLAVSVFAGQSWLALRFSQLQVFAQVDVLFDTDPSDRLEGFSHGWGAENRSLVHPNLANFVNPPLRLAARVLQKAGFGGEDILPLREKLALLIAPLCSALQALSVFLLFLRLGYSRTAASLLALFSACTFSQIVFGSIPEHFALSGLFLTFGFLLAADLLQGGEIRWPLWVFVGWLTAGVTISNLALIAILFFLALRLSHRPAAFQKVSALVAMVIAATFLSYLLLNIGYDVELPPPAKEIDRSVAYLKTDFGATLWRFPSAAANAIAPPAPALSGLHTLEPAAKYRFRFTLEGIPPVFTRKNILGSALILLLVAGALGHCRRGRPFLPLAAVAVAILVFNGLLHAVWGNEYFLYSQHWQMAAVFLAAGVFHFRGRSLALIPGTLIGLTAATALNNVINVQLILKTMKNVP